ncbi:MAG: PHP-associated domain-containing protein [Candidatus Woesearchaeota archaeon]
MNTEKETMKLKADLHIHTKEDPQDSWHITHSARDVIDKAKELDIKILAITLHNKVLEDKELFEYAKKKGILLIRGVERTINGHHTLIYGLNNDESEKIKNFNDLRALRKYKDILVIAPHPYYPNLLGHKNLHSKVEKHNDLFDALEVQQLYTKLYNPNKKAQRIAKKLKKGLVANSDTHKIEYFGEHHTLINLPKNYTEKDVFKAIRENKTELKIKPMTFYKCINYLIKHIHPKKQAKKIK